MLLVFEKFKYTLKELTITAPYKLSEKDEVYSHLQETLFPGNAICRIIANQKLKNLKHFKCEVAVFAETVSNMIEIYSSNSSNSSNLSTLSFSNIYKYARTAVSFPTTLKSVSLLNLNDTVWIPEIFNLSLNKLELSIADYVKIDINLLFIEKITKNSPQLKDINLDLYYTFSDKDINQIAINCLLLEKLTLNNVSLGAGARHIFAKMKHLRKLHFKNLILNENSDKEFAKFIRKSQLLMLRISTETREKTFSTISENIHCKCNHSNFFDIMKLIWDTTENISRDECELIIKDIYKCHPCASSPSQAQEIIQNLYLTGMSGLDSNKFDFIIDISNYYIEARNIDYTKTLVIRIDDRLNANIYEHFDEATNFINHCLLKNKTVVVHCAAGRSRSASIVIAYLIRFCNMSLQDAYIYVHSKRTCIDPNESFLYQLAKYENKLKF
ncbi:dual specificity protein phosphatase 14-like protein [Leptotrombidium deliense]|uniref:protein-tyrosine-phosphatase n=1 Tax=Leptotrombidium deliense TaxID=299467 RepID=A0A443S3Z3_9ACAR|nr:dual specificity protein phosphatase 14-like protein [Leptotrombidium deliense]